MKKIPISITAIATALIANTAALAATGSSHTTNSSEQFSSSNPSWETLNDNTAEAKGTAINITNSTYETGEGAGDVTTNLTFHHPFHKSMTTGSIGKFTRWYQVDGKTQIFRIFKDDQDYTSGSNGAKGRIEAFANASDSTVRATSTLDNQTEKFTFTARYHIISYNPSKKIKIFQAKARSVSGLSDPAWGPSINILEDGNVEYEGRSYKKVNVTSLYNTNGTFRVRSFDVKIEDDGVDYKMYYNGNLRIHGAWSRKDRDTVARWGMYLQANNGPGILSGDPEAIIYVSGAKVVKSTGNVTRNTADFTSTAAKR